MKLLSRLHKALFPGRLTILAYHSLVREPLKFPVWGVLEERLFRAQMAYLKSRFHVVSLREGVRRLREGALQDPAVAITFDDGYLNNFEIAFPILQQYGLPATLFLTTGLVDTAETLWHCRLLEALASFSPAELHWEGETFRLDSAGERAGAYRKMTARLKSRPHPRLLQDLGHLLRALGHSAESEAPSSFRMLNRAAIEKMASSGLIDFGAHTRSHAILGLLSGDEKSREIESSVRAVADLTGQPCRLFAYPNGKTADYDRESVDILTRCGVQIAVTTEEGLNGPENPQLELKRIGIGGLRGMVYFKVKTHHLAGVLSAS